jgi:SAM-dependent methyltransferase
MAAAYDQQYRASDSAPTTATTASLDSLVQSVEAYRTDGRWLDYGFGAGDLLAACGRNKWLCYGVEVAAGALERGRSRGWTVASEPRLDGRFTRAGFDVVSMIEFLEHVPEPATFIEEAARWLRPGGLLYITTPNARSVNRWLLGARWSIFSPPEHLTIWTARALRVALRRRGFRVVAVRTDGLNPAEIVARLRAPAGAPPVDRNQAAFALNEAFHRTPVRRATKRAANAVLTLLGIGDALKVRAERQANAPGFVRQEQVVQEPPVGDNLRAFP